MAASSGHQERLVGFDEEDAWDDGAIIKAFEKAVSMASGGKIKVGSSEKENNDGFIEAEEEDISISRKPNKLAGDGVDEDWKKGHPASSMMNHVEDKAVIQEWWSKASEALFKERDAKEAVSPTKRASAATTTTPTPTPPLRSPPPSFSPHPMHHPMHQNEQGDDPLSSMLLAWYYSGYHTGRYQAMQEMKARYESGGMM